MGSKALWAIYVIAAVTISMLTYELGKLDEAAWRSQRMIRLQDRIRELEDAKAKPQCETVKQPHKVPMI